VGEDDAVQVRVALSDIVSVRWPLTARTGAALGVSGIGCRVVGAATVDAPVRGSTARFSRVEVLRGSDLDSALRVGVVRVMVPVKVPSLEKEFDTVVVRYVSVEESSVWVSEIRVGVTVERVIVGAIVMGGSESDMDAVTETDWDGVSVSDINTVAERDVDSV
jgi:hypothetical protein